MQSDMELAYAGLQQLCAPLMDRFDELPEPQREALNVAFGRGVGPTPDRFLVGLAVLSLMAAAANDKSLLCIIDDAQWLDQVSVQTLGFVARRLMAEPVALVFAARHRGAEALAGLPELAVNGLSDAEARELLTAVIPGRIDERVRDRIVAETRGNPLALLEVPRNLSAVELAGGFGDPAAGRSAGQLEEGFVHRIESLPADTQQLLLVAAAEPIGDAALFLRAAANLGIPVDALAPAEAAGVIEFGPRMRFHHPLIRSAAYRAADLPDRRAIHRALADATDPQADPDRRAWHAANAAAGPDDAVAAELETSAGRAQSRGGIAAAAAFLERATALTSDPARRGSRAIAAAQAKGDAAAPEAAYELLAIAELGPLSDLQRAQVARMRAQMEFVRNRGGDSECAPTAGPASQLLDAARRLETLDDDLARETYLEALAAAMYAGRLGEPGDWPTRRGRPRRGRPGAGIASADGLTVERHGQPDRGDANGRSQRAASTLSSSSAPRRIAKCCAGCRWPSRLSQESAAAELWDDAVYLKWPPTSSGTRVTQVRWPSFRRHSRTGRGVTSTGRIRHGGNDYRRGRLDHLGDGLRANEVRRVVIGRLAWNPCRRGRLDRGGDCRGKRQGRRPMLGLAGYVSAVLYNGLGRYDEAFAAAREACEHEDLGFYGWCLIELVEAAVHMGEQATAAAAIRQLEERAGASGTDWGLGILASSRALLADDQEAEDLFTEAIERLARTSVVVHLARAHLRYGEWLRRRNRRLDARRHLNDAPRDVHPDGRPRLCGAGSPRTSGHR